MRHSQTSVSLTGGGSAASRGARSEPRESAAPACEAASRVVPRTNPRTASAERTRDPDDEAEVIPPAAIIDLIDPNVAAEETHDKRDRRDQSVPETGPKACLVSPR